MAIILLGFQTQHSARWPAPLVKAPTYDKDVLKITLAKKAEAKPKQIKVNVGKERSLEAKAPGKAP
jgi:hypothetical protein